ncbi:MAG TPA: UDP-N-acetylglucosamine 2-epimerase (non-hydrolyzing) [Candidatus Binatia bacterium]|nr:UDP-N-acetylglucosamine 2-epimerase (non-hydrolyzing) [Candidatus Binatia bacterium]
MAERRILCVFGTRPEAIKMVPVVRALAAHAPRLRPVVCVTDQHQEMLDQVLDFFGVAPDHRLGVMREGQSPSEVAARVLERLPPVLAAVRPAAVLVQGDTTTTLAAALAAFYGGVPVGHVEAGLRTYRKDAPFPEEVNRQLTTPIAEWHFAATAWARDNLLRERVAPEKVTVTGNPVIDALQWALAHLGVRRGAVLPGIERGRRLVLVTAHRRESFGAPFRELCEALRTLAEGNPEVELVYPVHLNPEVQAPVRGILAGVPRIHLLPPVDYWTMVDLLERCTLVLTDSGGIQEEAPSLGKPVLVLRETTERPEGIEAGTARLVGTSRARIVAEAERLLRDPAHYAAMATAHNPFGDGHAGERIARVLAGALGV